MTWLIARKGMVSLIIRRWHKRRHQISFDLANNRPRFCMGVLLYAVEVEHGRMHEFYVNHTGEYI